MLTATGISLWIGNLSMTNAGPERVDYLLQPQSQLSRWDNEGGAGPCGPKESTRLDSAASDIPELTNTELVQLRIRVIALENLVIALLADAPGRQLDLVREMAAYISPRPDSASHPLTIHAATQMVHLIERAAHFRTGQP